MNRRRFLAGILASGIAPAVIPSGVLMPVKRLAMPTPEEVVLYNRMVWNPKLGVLTFDGDAKVWVLDPFGGSGWEPRI